MCEHKMSFLSLELNNVAKDFFIFPYLGAELEMKNGMLTTESFQSASY